MAGAVTDTNEKADVAVTSDRDTAEARDTAGDTAAEEKMKNLVIGEDKAEAAGDDEAAAEADDNMESYIKHPLQNTWALWFLSNDKKISWEDRLINITNVDTVEDFWSLYNHIKTPSELQIGHDYNLFKNDIKPMWEHHANEKGAKLEIVFDRRPNKHSDIDKAWLDTMLLLIGEAFDNADEINGVVANIRQKQDKISIWLADKTNVDTNRNIALRWRSNLGLPKARKIMFHLHDANSKAKGIEY